MRKKIVVVILATTDFIIQPTSYFVFKVCFELKYSTHVNGLCSQYDQWRKKYERFQNKLSICAISTAYFPFCFAGKAFLGVRPVE